MPLVAHNLPGVTSAGAVVVSLETGTKVCSVFGGKVVGAGVEVGIGVGGKDCPAAEGGAVGVGGAVVGVGGAATGEIVPGREGCKVGAGVGGEDCPAGVGRTAVGEGVAGKGESVRSGSGGRVGVGNRDGGGEVGKAGAGEVIPAHCGGQRWAPLAVATRTRNEERALKRCRERNQVET